MPARRVGGAGGPPPAWVPGDVGPRRWAARRARVRAGFGRVRRPVSGELARLDQLRRSFQPRRFGSGYDRDQVDRLFDQLWRRCRGAARCRQRVDLDPKRFDLVPGGYFEAEVEQALEEVRDILRRL